MEYVLILLWVGIIALVVKYMQFKRTITVNGIETVRYTWFFAFIVFLPIILMAANRSGVGDTNIYIYQFLGSPSSISELSDFVIKSDKDKGFAFLISLIHIFFKNNTWFFLFVIALIQGLIVLSVFRKYSEDYLLCVFLFLASSDYISWMFNGIRQFLAVTIVFSAVNFMIKKKIIKYIAIVLFASLFHASALIMIPIYLICLGKAWNKKTIFFIIGVLLTITFVGQFTSFLDDSLQGTQYQNVITDTKMYDFTGTNPIRVMVYSVPAVLSFVYRRKIELLGDTLINICANMCIVSAGLYIISAFTSGIFFGRLPIYCSLFGYILVAWIFNNAVDLKMRKFWYVSTIILYLLFYYYQMHVTYNLI